MGDIKVATTITARCNSERFPYKVIGLLGGKPMIVQIIEKAKIMADLPIILATTWDREDDRLCKIAEEAGAVIFRGPAKNVLLRHQMLMAEHKLDWIVNISGDSPFFDVPISQRLIDGMYTFPDCDGIRGDLHDFPAMAEMNIAAPYSATLLEKYTQLINGHPRELEFQQGYGPAALIKPDIFDWIVVKTSDLITQSQTTIKLSVDYPLELVIANRIVEIVGHMPLTQREVLDAYVQIKSL